jgi:magnesium transporter
MTGSEVLRLLQRIGKSVENINDLYVLDEQDHLQGVARLGDVLTAPPDHALHTVLDRNPVMVEPETDQEEVAHLVSQYDLLSLPVVDANRRMLGIVTVDDVIDVLVQEGTEDVLRLGGVQSGATDETYFGVPIVRAIQRRVGWLLLLFLTGIITVNVLELFEGVLEQEVALSFFIPLLIGTGGNTGAQTVSTIVRSLALGEVRLHDVWRVVGREITGGLLLGVLLGVVGFILTLLLGNTPAVALVVSLTIVAICAWANVMGALVPLIVRRLGLDPALVSAPLITTLVDATGLAIYMLIAKLVLGL